MYKASSPRRNRYTPRTWDEILHQDIHSQEQFAERSVHNVKERCENIILIHRRRRFEYKLQPKVIHQIRFVPSRRLRQTRRTKLIASKKYLHQHETISSPTPHSSTHLSPQQHHFLQLIRNHPNFVFVDTDKNLGPVIIKR